MLFLLFLAYLFFWYGLVNAMTIGLALCVLATVIRDWNLGLLLNRAMSYPLVGLGMSGSEETWKVLNALFAFATFLGSCCFFRMLGSG